MESKKLNLMMSVLKIALIAIGVLAFFMVFQGPNISAEESVRQEFLEGGQLAFATSYTGFMLFAAAGLVLIFFVVQLITNTKKTVKAIMGLLIAVVIFFVLYMVGTTDTNESLQLKEAQHVSQNTISGTTAGIYTVLLGIGLGALAAILSPFMGRLRK